MSVMREVCQRGAFILQKDLGDFEADLANYLGVKHALGMANATDALIIGLRAAGVKPGDEVIFPSHTMVASPSAIFWAGATPVAADMGYDGLIDPEHVKSLITPRTTAIMPVQLNGRTCDMDRLMAIAEKHGLIVVEDAAQALGSKFKGKMAGTFGKAAAYSFYPAKTLGCFGDGGALVTNDDELGREVRLMRDHGRNDHGDVEFWGLNSRLDNLQAAVLHWQLKQYDDIVNRRRAIATMYQEQLGDMGELVLPPAPDSEPDHFDVFQNYELQADNRDSLRDHLKVNGIGTLIQWGGKGVHMFEKLGFKDPLPRTEAFFAKCIMLPMNMMITNDDVDFVCQQVRAFYGK